MLFSSHKYILENGLKQLNQKRILPQRENEQRKREIDVFRYHSGDKRLERIGATVYKTHSTQMLKRCKSLAAKVSLILFSILIFSL